MDGTKPGDKGKWWYAPSERRSGSIRTNAYSRSAATRTPLRVIGTPVTLLLKPHGKMRRTAKMSLPW